MKRSKNLPAKYKVIDANGQGVLPGFNERSRPLHEWRVSAIERRLRDANTPQEFAERIRDFAGKLRKEDGSRWRTGP